MKILEPLSKRLLAAGLAVSAVLFSASLLMFSIKPSVAGGENTPEPFPYFTEGGGKYMMFPYQEVINNSSGQFSRHENNMLIWDTQTGKSVIYSYYKHTEKGWGWHKLTSQLPANPLQ